jgi:cytochrome c oxidase subunit 2
VFVLSLVTLGAIVPTRGDRGDLVVEVTGRLWWWHVRYLDPTPSNVFATANEIRVPVGRRVEVRLTSDDVIHSFWVPSLQGKLDLIPGKRTVTWIRADEPGVYRGQCAEYCGLQHAKMAFTVVAMPPAEFASWLANQRRPAAEPRDEDTRRGQAVFLNSGCALCHTIRGTPTAGVTGPDLTHVASRLTLAAGTIPNTKGHLGGWVANPQGIKPGALMPRLDLPAPDFHALLHYLMSLR